MMHTVHPLIEVKGCVHTSVGFSSYMYKIQPNNRHFHIMHNMIINLTLCI